MVLLGSKVVHLARAVTFCLLGSRSIELVVY